MSKPGSGLSCQIYSRTGQACQSVDDRIEVHKGYM